MLSRSGGTSAGRITHAAVDATDVDATGATQGADVVYNCAAPAYTVAHRLAAAGAALLAAAA